MIQFVNKSARFLALPLAVLAWATSPIGAAVIPPALMLSDGTNSVTVDSTGAVTYGGGCTSTTCHTISVSVGTGYVGWSGVVGPFTVINAVGQTNQIFSQPKLDLGLGTVFTSTGGTLTAAWTVTNLAVTGPLDLAVITTNNLPTNDSVYIDPLDRPFGEPSPAAIDLSTSSNLDACSSGPLCIPFTGPNSSSSVTEVAVVNMTSGIPFSDDLAFTATALQDPSTSLGNGDTATIGFWHNKNGQTLIESLNGGSTATNLSGWLANNFPYLYGAHSATDVAGESNDGIAHLFNTLFGASGQRTQAQILATALACYSTSSILSNGLSASLDGFKVTPAGSCAVTYNVGSEGAAIGLLNNTSYTLMQLLAQANQDVMNGSFNANANALNVIFSAINQTGDIN